MARYGNDFGGGRGFGPGRGRQEFRPGYDAGYRGARGGYGRDFHQGDSGREELNRGGFGPGHYSQTDFGPSNFGRPDYEDAGYGQGSARGDFGRGQGDFRDWSHGAGPNEGYHGVRGGQGGYNRGMYGRSTSARGYSGREWPTGYDRDFGDRIREGWGDFKHGVRRTFGGGGYDRNW